MIKVLDWTVRSVASAILLWSLVFKFGNAPESVDLFSRLGVEPWGRVGTALVEAIVIFLLVIPRTAWLGGICGMVLMGGAILSHLLVLGINLLFALAVVVFVCCLTAFLIHRRDVTFVVED